MNKQQRKIESYIIAEFTKQLKTLRPIAVQFTDDEEIHVTVGTDLYVMKLGSDDDEFSFTEWRTEQVVRFPIPLDVA